MPNFCSTHRERLTGAKLHSSCSLNQRFCGRLKGRKHPLTCPALRTHLNARETPVLTAPSLHYQRDTHNLLFRFSFGDNGNQLSLNVYCHLTIVHRYQTVKRQCYGMLPGYRQCSAESTDGLLT